MLYLIYAGMETITRVLVVVDAETTPIRLSYKHSYQFATDLSSNFSK